MNIGDRVRYSGYVTNRARDYWNNCGREPQKSGAKKELDRLVALRGTVMEILDPGLTVKWDNGSVSNCLSYIVEPA